MPSLSDRLKALGVKVGAQDLPAPQPKSTAGSRAGEFSIENVLPGHDVATPVGETFILDTYYPADFNQGRAALRCDAPLNLLARWAGDEQICNFPPQSFAFLDTETTGLAGGTGVYPFLVGIGRLEGDQFHLAQFFMRDPAVEPAQLAAIEAFLAPCDAVVTFNGKSFDIPLLTTRYITHGWQSPFPETAHVDLLHLSRRLWRDRLPSRTLGNLEVQILGAERTTEDIPGWMIPSLYFQYLRDGDARPLKNVFYHNAMDVVSMAALFTHVASLLADPFHQGDPFGVDLISLARLFEDLGELDTAARLYLDALNHEDARQERIPAGLLLEAIQSLAAIHKRLDNLQAAVSLWEEAARQRHLDAHLELAKFYEHRQRDYQEAARWTRRALDLVQGPGFTLYERRQLEAELDHRLARLAAKIAKSNSVIGQSSNPAESGHDIIPASEE